MLRRLPLLIFLVAALLVAEPLLHTHPLLQRAGDASTSATSCAVCASGVGRLPLMVPSVAAPQMVVYTLTSAAPTIVTVPVAIALASRAPPLS
jgi:hypothetical protein